MPCGCGDIGLNVWVENNELLFYLSRSGTFDENNQMLKLGRIRLRLSPTPFLNAGFRQQLRLESGDVRISAGGTDIRLWVDVFRPIVHLEIASRQPTEATVSYESWRLSDRELTGQELWATSYRDAKGFAVINYHDNVAYRGDRVEFYHRNRSDVENVFARTVDAEGMGAVKSRMFNPVVNRTFGGELRGKNMRLGKVSTGSYNGIPFRAWTLESRRPSKSQSVEIALHVAQSPTLEKWRDGLDKIWEEARRHHASADAKTRNWWNSFWKRSYIFLNAPDPKVAEAGRNYQLFRYMLAANAYGEFPTKFNGGLFTFDPNWVEKKSSFSPDFRRWGGGTMTAQNQRLVYYPMFGSGDFDMLKPQFDFYLRSLRNAELRSRIYWQHGGASFTEQVEDFGLPNLFEWGYNRPADAVRGVEYNRWLEYLWDTVLEFCSMMLDTESYKGRDIHDYVPFVESCLQFFDEHYRQLDADGHYILYPGSAAETFKLTRNSASTIAALRTVTDKLLALPAGYLNEGERRHWKQVASRVPPIPLHMIDGHMAIAPAETWQRIQNVESPQLYPVFPWGIYGLGRPGLDVALNTYRYDPNVIKFRSYVGWKQDNIFAARVGLAEDAATLTLSKLANGPHRFPAFWGPGFDWTPDHNWGGTAAIGLQEMIMQTDGAKIYLLPAWPKSWSAHFKLHAPKQTTVEGVVENGKLRSIQITPESRRKDLIVQNAMGSSAEGP